MYTNGTETISGKRIVVDGRIIINPTPEMLADAGWTKVEPHQPSDEELAAMQRATEVENLKMQLAESDYKVIKIAECVACNLPMPYDAEQLHSERQAIRDEINRIESMTDEEYYEAYPEEEISEETLLEEGDYINESN